MEISAQQENPRHKQSENSGTRSSCLFDLIRAETPNWGQIEEDYPQATSQGCVNGAQARLETLLHQNGNTICADCGSPDPKWVSLSHGVFVCIKCSGVHRSLGVHISKIVSVKLDQWTEEQVKALEHMGGNSVANTKYEACIPQNLRKPKPNASSDERSDFIKRKYEMLQFLDANDPEQVLLCPVQSSNKNGAPTSNSSSDNNNNSNNNNNKKHYEKQQTKLRLGSAFRNSKTRNKESDRKNPKKSNSSAGMVEFIGLIKVNVVKGTNLAVRDVLSSDPYVMLSLGKQSVKTHVVKNNLNPVWNESLMLSIPDHVPCLKVLVYDKDTFKSDDFMGEAEIDIQPLLSAARAYEKSEISEPTQLGKWVANVDNTLERDGIITLVDGKVKQEISIRLQKVERGVLEIELECVPLTQ